MRVPYTWSLNVYLSHLCKLSSRLFTSTTIITNSHISSYEKHMCGLRGMVVDLAKGGVENLDKVSINNDFISLRVDLRKHESGSLSII